MGPKRQQYGAYAIKTWTSQKGKSKRMSRTQIMDKVFAEAEILGAEGFVVSGLEHNLWF